MTRLTLSRRDFITSSTAAATLLLYSRSFAQQSDLTALTIQEASKLIRSGFISPVDLTQAYLERIEQLETTINAYITVMGKSALEQARQLETELLNGRWRGPLHGIPVALKDSMDTAGVLTTAASELFSKRIPKEDAEVVRRLKKAGAIILGKLNMHEFAFGGTSAVTHYNPVHNPWNLDYIPGGSSGGSGAAVVAQLCAAALGTDTAASIRMPAAFCGIVGLKATYGLVSIRGIIPLSESMDHAGPMCRTVGDTALMLQALAGYDAKDVSSIRSHIPNYSVALNQPTSDFKLGIPRKGFYDDLDPDIEQAMQTALDVISNLTASARDVELPGTPPFMPIISEAYAYHAEYVANKANHKRYQPSTLQRILGGANTSQIDYLQAIRQLTLSRKAIATVFDEVDLLITPTTPVLPHLINEPKPKAGETVPEITTRNTLPFNFYGIPTISVPCGFSRSGLPIGMQISGPRLGEVSVLALAHAYEQATDWHIRKPPLA